MTTNLIRFRIILLPRETPDIDPEGENEGEDAGVASNNLQYEAKLYKNGKDTSREAEFVLPDGEEESIFYSGLEVDYSSNETLGVGDDPNKQISAPGCPASGEKSDIETHLFSNRSIWVHYGNPPRCFLVGSQGPCRAGMRLGLQSGSYVGKCKCKCFVEFTKLEYLQTYKEHDFSNLDLDPFLDEKQSFCFDYDKGHFALYEGKCHMLLTQGPCKNNEAFVLNSKTSEPSCEVRECPEAETEGCQSPKFGYAIKQNGRCSKLQKDCVNYTSAGVKTNDGLSHKYLVLGTTIDNPMPSCITPKKSVEFYDGGYKSGGRSLVPSDCAKINQYFSTLLRRCIPYNSRGRSKGIG